MLIEIFYEGDIGKQNTVIGDARHEVDDEVIDFKSETYRLNN